MATKPIGLRLEELHAPGHQQAEGLVGVAAGEAVEAEVAARAAREGLGEEMAGAGHAADLGLQRQPLPHVVGQAGPGGGVREELDHPVREERRGGELGAGVDRDPGRGGGLAGDLDGHLAQEFVADGLAAEEEGVAGGERGGEVLLDLAEGSAAAALEADLQQSRSSTMVPTFIRMARARRGSRSCQRPSRRTEALPAVVGPERVAAGGAVGEAGVEVGARQGAVGAGGRDLGEERVGVERAGAGGEQDVLAEDVERAGAARARRRGCARGRRRGRRGIRAARSGSRGRARRGRGRCSGGWRGRCAGRGA